MAAEHLRAIAEDTQITERTDYSTSAQRAESALSRGLIFMSAKLNRDSNIANLLGGRS